jgi:hypothetical protein
VGKLHSEKVVAIIPVRERDVASQGEMLLLERVCDSLAQFCQELRSATSEYAVRVM